jgi:hypothetical protein
MKGNITIFRKGFLKISFRRIPALINSIDAHRSSCIPQRKFISTNDKDVCVIFQGRPQHYSLLNKKQKREKLEVYK